MLSSRQETVLAVLFHLAGGQRAIRDMNEEGEEVIATLKPLWRKEVVVAIDRGGCVRPVSEPPG